MGTISVSGWRQVVLVSLTSKCLMVFSQVHWHANSPTGVTDLRFTLLLPPSALVEVLKSPEKWPGVGRKQGENETWPSQLGNWFPQIPDSTASIIIAAAPSQAPTSQTGFLQGPSWRLKENKVWPGCLWLHFSNRNVCFCISLSSLESRRQRSLGTPQPSSVQHWMDIRCILWFERKQARHLNGSNFPQTLTGGGR